MLCHLSTSSVDFLKNKICSTLKASHEVTKLSFQIHMYVKASQFQHKPYHKTKMLLLSTVYPGLQLPRVPGWKRSETPV